jgi:predicted transcriptional regulator
MILDLTPETDQHLQELAASAARPAEDLAREAVERFVAHRRDLSSS